MSEFVRHIAVVTGTRSEFGLLEPLIRTLQTRHGVKVSLVASAAHLSPSHGKTVKEIELSGLPVAATVDMLLASQTREGIAKSLGVGVFGFADSFNRLNPGIVVILGDRFELLAAASVLLILGIPIAHIHGGEVTSGAFDDSIRHAITKMASLHFVAAQQFADRVIQLGEDPSRVFNVGALGVENLRSLRLYSRDELSKELGFNFNEPYMLATYHPVTNEADIGLAGLQGMLEALKKILSRSSDPLNILITLPNADPGNNEIAAILRRFASEHQGRVFTAESLGTVKYLSAMKHSSLVIGNSSSGIIEAPSLGVPTVNIGDRQAGRPQANSVIQTSNNGAEILKATIAGLSADFRAKITRQSNPYASEGTSSKIADVLEKFDLTALKSKQFYDLIKD